MKLQRASERATDVIGRKRMWQLETLVIGSLCAMIAQKFIKVVYGVARHDKSRPTPFDPSYERFSWPNALLWAAAAGVGLGVAKVLGNRAAAAGWQFATGTPPPGKDSSRDQA